MTLRPRKQGRKKELIRKKDLDTRLKGHVFSTHRGHSSKKDVFDTRPMIERINERFSWQIESIQEPELLAELQRIIKKRARESKPSPIFRRIMNRVEKEIEHRPEWQKYIISSAVKYAYIGIREGIPRFSAIEKTMEGFLSRNYQKLTRGVIELVTGETYVTLLFEIIENPEELIS